ncbi:hypothetical protein Efla_007061 [Eimeria flavescens]
MPSQFKKVDCSSIIYYLPSLPNLSARANTSPQSAHPCLSTSSSSFSLLPLPAPSSSSLPLLTMASSAGGWCLIESDPGVFSALVEEIGVKGVSFSEVYGLDAEAFAALEGPTARTKVLGFIFLFNYGKVRQAAGAAGQSDSRPVMDATAEDAPFFVAQTVENACASQAILSVLLNRKEEIKDLGKPISDLYAFIKDFRDPAMRGEAIGGCDAIRNAHNSFRPSSSFEVVDEEDGKAKDAFHFISYIPKGEKVYELDGLKQGPVCVGSTSEGDWKEVVRKEIVRRVEEIQAQGEELRFNLMAVTTNPIDAITAELEKLQQTATAAANRLEGKAGDEAVDLPASRAEVERIYDETVGKIAELQEELKAEHAKRTEWTRENARRRHDFTPFVLCALRHLASKRQLVNAVRRAISQKEEEEAAKKNGKKAKA